VKKTNYKYCKGCGLGIEGLRSDYCTYCIELLEIIEPFHNTILKGKEIDKRELLIKLRKWGQKRPMRNGSSFISFVSKVLSNIIEDEEERLEIALNI